MKSRALWYAVSGLLWVAVPLVASAAGLVPCSGAADCNICTFGSLIQAVINFVIGLSIPLAAVLFAYAGWLYFSNRENTSQIEKAHHIFTTVFIGFAIAVGGWLIVQTVLKTLAPGYQSWTTFTCNNNSRIGSTPGNSTNIGQLFQQSGLPGLSTTAPPLGNQNYGGPINSATGCTQGDYLMPDGSCQNAMGGTYLPGTPSSGDGQTYGRAGAQCAPENPACSPEALQALGYDPQEANAMSCIAITESSGNPYTPNSSTGACGLFQITNQTSRSNWQNPAYHGEGCSVSTSCNDPRCNAQTAQIMFNQQGYQPWTGVDPSTGQPWNQKARDCVQKYDPAAYYSQVL